VYLSVCLAVGVSARCDWSSLPPEAIRHHLYLTRLPPEAMPLYPANLPQEAVRDFSTLQIYREYRATCLPRDRNRIRCRVRLIKSCVNILCQAMREHFYLQIYRRRPRETSKGYTITAADGVVALALACQVWWFKPAPSYVVYRE
jgi:hypothetical protein